MSRAPHLWRTSKSQTIVPVWASMEETVQEESEEDSIGHESVCQSTDNAEKEGPAVVHLDSSKRKKSCLHDDTHPSHSKVGCAPRGILKFDQAHGEDTEPNIDKLSVVENRVRSEAPLLRKTGFHNSLSSDGSSSITNQPKAHHRKQRPSLRRAVSEVNCKQVSRKKFIHRNSKAPSWHNDYRRLQSTFDSAILEMPVELLEPGPDPTVDRTVDHDSQVKNNILIVQPEPAPYQTKYKSDISQPISRPSRNLIRRFHSTAVDVRHEKIPKIRLHSQKEVDLHSEDEQSASGQTQKRPESFEELTRHTSFDNLTPIGDQIDSHPIRSKMPHSSFNVSISGHSNHPGGELNTDKTPVSFATINPVALADGSLLEQNSEYAKQSTSSFLKEQFLAFFQPSDNKLAMKLFGSKNALLKEKKRQEQQGKWVIHPCSSFRFYWDLLMLVLLIANLIILPVAISFFNDDLSMHWIIFNTISDVIFVADIAVKFRTGVVANDYADEIILNPKEIARHYLRSWFILDFISSIPMDYIYLIFNNKDHYNQILSAGRTLRILRLAKLLSMLRLLRLTRLVRYVSQWEEFLNIASKFMGIFNLVLLMLLLGHWNACLQYLIPMLMEFPPDSWVKRCKLEDADWFQQYTWALFKAMSHMLSIGYGRFPPISISDAWITIVSMMSGATCYALFVGHAAALIQSFDTSKRLYREKFKQVEEYMAYRKLPRALRQRIANYYEHRYQGKMFDEAQILNEFSECLREQVINYNCRALVAAVPFFTYADQDFVSEVVTKLKFEVFQPGDLIIKEGTIGNKMYFIQEGIVDIITKEGDVATSLSDGSYFGEIGLLTNARRVASVKAVVYSNLYSLDRESFISVLENYPLMRRTMESVAAERLSKIGQNPAIVSNREDLKEDLSLVKEIVSSAVTPEATSSESESDHDNSQSYLNLKNFLKIGKSKRMSARSPPELDENDSASMNQPSPDGTKHKLLHPNVTFVGRIFKGVTQKWKSTPSSQGEEDRKPTMTPYCEPNCSDKNKHEANA